MTDRQIFGLKNVLLYILKNFSGGLDYIKLYKILYFANKEQLAMIGVPMVHDNFKAWKNGPVPSFTGTMLKHIENGDRLTRDMLFFDKAIKIRKNQRVLAVEESDIEALPRLTRELLDSYIKKYKYANSKILSAASHDAAWDEAYNARGGRNTGHEVINPVAMAKVGGASDDTLSLLTRYYGDNDTYVNIHGEDISTEKYERSALEIYSLQQLTDGWDGDEAENIDDMVGKNCRELLSYSKSKPQYIDALYPTPVGSICIDWIHKGSKISAEISSGQIAFYYVSSNRNEIYDSPILQFGYESINLLFSKLELMD